MVIAHAIGQGDRDAVRKSVHTAIVLSLAGGVAVAILGELIAAPLLRADSWPAAAFSGAEGPETAGAVSLLLCSVSLLLFRKKYHSILREGRV